MVYTFTVHVTLYCVYCVLITSYLRWVDDSCELLDPKHAQVGDGECPTNKLLWL